jgi:hypothetical protein
MWSGFLTALGRKSQKHCSNAHSAVDSVIYGAATVREAALHEGTESLAWTVLTSGLRRYNEGAVPQRLEVGRIVRILLMYKNSAMDSMTDGVTAASQPLTGSRRVGRHA